VLSTTRALRVANPSGEKLAREASWIHVGKFAKQIELAFSYDVDWIRDGEVITDVLVCRTFSETEVLRSVPGRPGN
jgi:hypothetical protein